MTYLKENSDKRTLYSNIVDLSFLNEHLSSDLDALSQMIALFIEQTPNKINLLEESVLNKDYPSIKATSHFLKSSFTIMGLSSITSLTEMELLSVKSNDIEKITPLSNIVILNFNESLIEYKKILSEVQSKIEQK